jgi:hypothetical protein
MLAITEASLSLEVDRRQLAARRQSRPGAHGKARPPHVVGVLTVGALLVAAPAGHTGLLGRASRYVETVSYSITALLRVPPRRPWVATPEAPASSAHDWPPLRRHHDR